MVRAIWTSFPYECLCIVHIQNVQKGLLCQPAGNWWEYILVRMEKCVKNSGSCVRDSSKSSHFLSSWRRKWRKKARCFCCILLTHLLFWGRQCFQFGGDVPTLYASVLPIHLCGGLAKYNIPYRGITTPLRNLFLSSRLLSSSLPMVDCEQAVFVNWTCSAARI